MLILPKTENCVLTEDIKSDVYLSNQALNKENILIKRW